MADIYYTDAPTIDGTPYPMPAAPTHRRRGLRNWQIAVVYAMIHAGVMTVLVMLATGSNDMGLLSLAIHGAMLLLAVAIYNLVNLVRR